MNTSELIERLHSTFERGTISEHDRCLIDDACCHMERLEAETVSLNLVISQLKAENENLLNNTQARVWRG